MPFGRRKKSETELLELSPPDDIEDMAEQGIEVGEVGYEVPSTLSESTDLIAHSDTPKPDEPSLFEVKKGRPSSWSLTLYPNWVRVEKSKRSLNIPLALVTDVQYQPPIGLKTGYINFMTAKSKPVVSLMNASMRLSAVAFSKSQESSVERFKRVIEARIRELNPDAAFEGDTPLRVLDGKIRNLVRQNMYPGEIVLQCLVGAAKQSLIGLDSRILIVKAGMSAGTTFGAKVTSFNYSDLTGVEVRIGMASAVIEFTSPSFQKLDEKTYWGTGEKDSAFYAPNCIPINKASLGQPNVQDVLNEIRQKIANPPHGVTIASLPTPLAGDVPLSNAPSLDDLEKLAELRDKGIITEEEFAAKKKQILDL